MIESTIRFVIMVTGFSFIWYQIFKVSDNLKRIADVLELGQNVNLTINKLTLKNTEAEK